MNEWRKLALRDRRYDAYRRVRFIENGCDHAGPYCKCDPPYWLRESSPAEADREARVA